ncbi:MAG: beta-L-arabinofuranosidase domain-containing protein [Candidatus Caldatribacteriaceae bacterium]
MEKKNHKERTRIVSPSLRKVSFKNGFLGQRVHQNTEVIIPYQWEALNDRVPGAPQSHALENLRIAAGLTQGEFQGLVFQDSDIAKWLEAVSYSLEYSPNQQLERLAKEVIEIVTHAQWSDGYLNSYFTIKGRNRRWTNLRDNHELYCTGHWIEAGIAHLEATGKRTLFDCVCRLADHIAPIFGPEPHKKRGYPGHPEVELALVKLYRVTQKRAYLELSRFFCGRTR